MKILLAFNQDPNPYVEVILDGMQSAGCYVDTGTEKFWDEYQFDYDIVHIQWPETLFDWRVPSKIELQFLRRRLKEVRKRAKIVFTRHNEVSHHINEHNEHILKGLYELCETECHVMIHLGEVSQRDCQFRSELSDKRHVMIPNPVCDKLYAHFLMKDSTEMKRQAGIPANRQVVLAFGNFRFEAEKQLVLGAFLGLKGPKPYLFAPRWFNPWEYAFIAKHPMLTVRSARKTLWMRINRMKLGAKRILSHEEVASSFAAADVIFIQRIDELNSGNMPMAFLFKKVVVGPDCGNIGEWCRITGNPVFDPKNPVSVSDALREGLDLASSGLGEENYKFAMSHWPTDLIGMEHAALYGSLNH